MQLLIVNFNLNLIREFDKGKDLSAKITLAIRKNAFEIVVLLFEWSKFYSLSSKRVNMQTLKEIVPTTECTV